jgi:ribosomal protein S1
VNRSEVRDGEREGRGIDRDRQRVPLPIKGLGTGQTMDATITRVMPYGAFAPSSGSVEGLIDVTEFSAERVGELHALLRIGDVLPVRIVAIDPDWRRLSLSARLAERT